MGKQQYTLHPNIAFLPPIKLGRSTVNLINPTQGDIPIANRKFQNNLHEYHLFNNMNSVRKKIVVAVIDDQWIKGAKNMVMGYANKSFVDLMDWIYVRYVKIMPGELMHNQDEMRSTYNFKLPIEILFNQMQMGQEFAISGNSPFFDQKLAYMRVTKILATQEYTHVYFMWKIIADDDHTMLQFEAHLQ